MPKSLLQEIVFTVLMVFVMVYAMICYNIALNIGAMTNEVFLLAFHELYIMGPIAFVLDFFLVGFLAKKITLRIFNPQRDNPFFIILGISAVSVLFMCPLMSLFATLLFKDAGSEFVAVWFQTTIFNFPMALCWQIFFAGPLVRLIFRTIFTYIPSAVKRRKARGVQSEVACAAAGAEVAEKEVSSVTDSAPSQNSEENKS